MNLSGGSDVPEGAAVDQGSQSSTSQSSVTSAERPTGRTSRRSQVSMRHVRGVTSFLRAKVAGAVWLLAALCAAVLAIGAMLSALDANPDNPVVEWFTRSATWLAGPLSTVFEFQKQNGAPDEATNRLVNWGVAALVFLVVGRVAYRLVRPRV